MTGPYVYGANSPHPTPYQHTPYTAYYSTPQHSPFVPPIELGAYPPSPYRGASPLPGAAELPPNTSGGIPFPGSYDAAGYPYTSPYQRPRASSFHGQPISPFIPPAPTAPTTPPWPRSQRLSNPMYPGVTPVTGYPVTVSPWSVASPLPGSFPDQSAAFALHPFLDGNMPRLDFALSLATQHFMPMQLLPTGAYAPVGAEVLGQPATHPPLYRLRIVCDELPHWPIALEYNPEDYRQQTGAMLMYPPPVSVGDVLAQIHRTLHERISHADWARLDDKKKYKISQAYTTRCASSPSMEHLLKSDGVKKVDYLLDKVWFRGLIKTHDGPDAVKLVVSRRAN